jgi:hypothetical protein
LQYNIFLFKENMGKQQRQEFTHILPKTELMPTKSFLNCTQTKFEL